MTPINWAWKLVVRASKDLLRTDVSVAYWEDAHSQSVDLNLNVKVLDFVKSGGPRRTDLRTFRWEVRI